nr:MAG TPA: hypothetical protein [Bacteriophage sp.]
MIYSLPQSRITPLKKRNRYRMQRNVTESCRRI